jgi:hypothetical protein
MRYQTPQFINIEDKIFGPFSFKQFIYMGGSAGLGYVFYHFLPILLAIPLIIIVGGLGLALAFYKVNNRPFALLIQAFFLYISKNKLYLWKKVPRKAEQKDELGTQEMTTEDAPRLSGSKLQNLAWSLDVLDIDKK